MRNSAGRRFCCTAAFTDIPIGNGLGRGKVKKSMVANLGLQPTSGGHFINKLMSIAAPTKQNTVRHRRPGGRFSRAVTSCNPQPASAPPCRRINAVYLITTPGSRCVKPPEGTAMADHFYAEVRLQGVLPFC